MFDFGIEYISVRGKLDSFGNECDEAMRVTYKDRQAQNFVLSADGFWELREAGGE